jgi:tetratricopeptide (TPR) repeat protein
MGAMGPRNPASHSRICIAAVLVGLAMAPAAAFADSPVQIAQATSPKFDLEDWNAVKDSKNAADYQTYLSKHPDGAFADLAKLRIKQYTPAAPEAAAPAAPAADPQLVEINDWNAVKNSNKAADFENFLKKHPNGNFRDLANLRLKELNAVAQPAAAEPATQPASAAPAAQVPAAPAPSVAPAAPAFDDASLKLYAKSGARLRAAPDKDAAVVTKLAVNTEMNVTGRSQDGAWLRVAAADGGTAYVAAVAASEKPIAVSKPKPKDATPAAPALPDDQACKIDSAAAPNDRVSACERLAAKAGTDADKLATLGDLAAALDKAGRTDEAVRKYEQAAALSPNDPTIYYRLGLVRLEQNRFPEARAAFDKAAMLDNKNPDYVYQRGIAAAGLGDFSKARDEVKRALLSKDSAEYYETLGEYQLALGDLDEVKVSLERGRKIDPNRTSLTLAVLDYYTGNLDRALSEASAASGDSPYAPIWKALVQKAKGDDAGAMQTLESARGALGKDWPAPVYDYLAGKIPEGKLTTSAKTSDRTAFAERLCIAKFFAGEWAFRSKDNDAGRTLLQDAAGTQAFYRLEFAAAKARLANMMN